MQENVQKRILQSLLAGFISAAVVSAAAAFGWLAPWEAKTWDWRAKVMARPGVATGEIRLILLDQNSLDWARSENGLTWPWPREVYGAIVDFCKWSEAKAVVFDVLFTEPSKYGVEDDEAFGAAISAYGPVTVPAFVGENAGDQPLLQAEPPADGSEGATLPIPEVADAAAVIGNVHLRPDADGIYRRIRLVQFFAGKPVPALGLGAYLSVHPDARIAPEGGHLVFGNRKIPVDKTGHTLLRYRGPSGTHRSYSAAAVLQSEILRRSGQKPLIDGKAAFGGKYVLFGFTAPGLYDLKSSPVGGVYPGVEIHATVLDNLISGDFLQPVPAWLDILSIFALAMGCTFCISFFSLLPSIGLSAAFVLSPILFSFWMYREGFWLSLAAGELALLLSIVSVFVLYYAVEGKQKRFIKNAFRQYLSPAVIDQLISNPAKLKLGGERKELSIFFSDLQGFTSISEGLSPEELVAVLNDYLSEMTQIIHEEGGTVDKYEGDAVISFWNAPLESADHALRAVAAAVRCQGKLSEMEAGFRSRIGHPLRTRIGIHTGPAVVGNIGSHLRFDYTVLGDSVNLASRLEGANKVFGTKILISEDTRKGAGEDFAYRELGRLAVVGRKRPVTVFEPMHKETYAAGKEVFQTFRTGLDLFYRGEFLQALEVFSETERIDPPASMYAKECRKLSVSPPAVWDGVLVLTGK